MSQIKIQGRIIRIIDNRTAIINLGGNNGITDRSIFHILGDPETIIDPFSEEELGQIIVVKSKLKAEQVYENFTIATTRWTIETYRPGTIGSLINSFTDPYDIKVVDHGELRVRPEDVQPWKAQSETPVRVGDIVEVVVYQKHNNDESIEEDSDNDQPISNNENAD